MQTDFTVRVIGNELHILANGVGVGMSYSTAVELRTILRRAGRQAGEYAKTAKSGGDTTACTYSRESVLEISVQAVGPAVLVELRGQRWFEYNYRFANTVIKAIANRLLVLDELNQALRLIEDEALLLRTGLPIGLTKNKKIKREAWKRAEDIRIPNGVEPTTVFYPPTINVHPSTNEV